MTEEDPDGTTGKATETEDAMGDPNGAPDPILELDEVFAALGHPRRRYLLYTLVNGSTEAPLSDLAADIAAWELEKPASEVTVAERRTVHISLYHSHIPKLASLGVVDYHEGENVIVRAVNTAQVQAVLDGAGAELDSRQESHVRDTDDRKSE
jgi:DNA-binding transcriptional ArsR family regulator